VASTFNVDAFCQRGLLLEHFSDAAIESLFDRLNILSNLNLYLFLLLFEHFQFLNNVLHHRGFLGGCAEVTRLLTFDKVVRRIYFHLGHCVFLLIANL